MLFIPILKRKAKESWSFSSIHILSIFLKVKQVTLPLKIIVITFGFHWHYS